jgi:hypothetical protein
MTPVLSLSSNDEKVADQSAATNKYKPSLGGKVDIWPPANTTRTQGKQNKVNIRWSRLTTKMPITRGTSGTGELENR